MAKISIAIPTYNGAPYLEECLESAVGQTFSDIEIVVVDDCSTDETLSIAKKLGKQDRRVKVFQNRNRLGLVENWNRCIQHSTGEWIKFLFQDDFLDENCLDRMLNASKKKKGPIRSNFVVCERNFLIEEGVADHLKHFYEELVITLKDVFGGNSSILPEDFSGAILTRGVGLNFVGEPTSVMLRREICFQYSFFNQNLIHLCDLEYWTRIGTNEGMVYLPERLAKFRVHSRSASAHNHAHKKFQLEYLDLIVVLHDYLFHPAYDNFRKTPNAEPLLSDRLRHEMKNLADLMVRFSKDESLASFQDLVRKYPILKRYMDERLHRLVGC